MTDSHPDERPQRRREYSGPGSTLGLAALIIAVVGFAIWWFEFRATDSAAGPGVPGLGIIELSESLNPTGRPPAAREGRAAPNFKLQTPEGETHTLDEYRGKYVLLNFWASWCGPCRGETPDLQDFYQMNSARGAVVIGVNQQEQADTARAFAVEFGVTYPILLDPAGEVSNAYQFPGLPATFLIDPQGVVERVYLGRISLDQITEIEERIP
ncbi:MAG TPA: TlpA disulfide reductase family protein [Tepidiformaceae bacterium]|nr:TlpA disulfide reductase family protein [Tepidiformaceae bacterium]